MATLAGLDALHLEHQGCDDLDGEVDEQAREDWRVWISSTARQRLPHQVLTPEAVACFPRVEMTLTRSEQMARIRGRDTAPERLLRRALWRAGYRYHLHRRIEAGRPDLVFSRQRVVVFIDGCFWHGCPEHYVRPRSSGEFWAAKLIQNIERDRVQTRELESRGWRVCRIWEHIIFEDLAGAIREVVVALEQTTWEPAASWRVDRVEPLEGVPERIRQHLVTLHDPVSVGWRIIVRHTRKWARGTVRGKTRSKGPA